MQKSFGERLACLRGEQSQTEIASIFGIKQPTYSGWESNTRKPDIIELCNICKHFNVSADWLLGLSDDASRPSQAAASAKPASQPDAYWRDLVAGQQVTILKQNETISGLSAAVIEFKRASFPAPIVEHDPAAVEEAMRKIGENVERMAVELAKGRSSPVVPVQTGGRSVKKPA